MEDISILTMRIGTFREVSIKIALLYKESTISPVTYPNQLSQVIVHFDVDILLENSSIDSFAPQRPIMIWVLTNPHT